MLLVLWALLFLMIYKVLTLEKDYIEYDPFEILQLDPVSDRCRERGGCPRVRCGAKCTAVLCMCRLTVFHHP